MEKSWEMFQAREVRCKHISAVLKSKDQDDQSLWLDQIPKLPVWIPRRKGRKRVRSSSRPRSSSKRFRPGDQPHDPIDIPDDDPVVINEEVLEQVVIIEEDEFETPGINDPKPVCRKRMGRKKKKGKKSNKAKDNRTYDELIEAPKFAESDSEFDLQMDFTEKLV